MNNPVVAPEPPAAAFWLNPPATGLRLPVQVAVAPASAKLAVSVGPVAWMALGDLPFAQ
jgi:hypothetical protein